MMLILELIQAAKNGDAEAQYGLADAYYNGKGFSQDFIKAFEYYQLAADQEFVSAQYSLAYCYEHGLGCTKNYNKAVKYYQFAADQGLASAQYEVGLCYANGKGINEDYVQAVKYYQLAVDQGLASAQYELGFCYADGKGVSQDYIKAFEYYQLAADQKYAKAQDALGGCYEHGQSCIKDYNKAVEYYQLASDQGLAIAQCSLATCYYEGNGVSKDYTKAVKYYQLAADQGFAIAQCNLAICYNSGQGVPQDYTKAIKYYRHAAAQGLAAAQYYLAKYYEYGLVLSQDWMVAIEYYQLAADQGFPEARRKLAYCYENGELGILKNCSKAREYSLHVDDQENLIAQSKLKPFFDLEYGPSYEKLIEALNKQDGNTKLHRLALYNTDAAVLEAEKICRKWNTSLSAKNTIGWTALHVASALGNEKMVEFLVGEANSYSRTLTWVLVPRVDYDIDVKTNKGQSALDLALMYGNAKAAALLLTSKAKLYFCDLPYAVRSFARSKDKNKEELTLHKENLDKISAHFKKMYDLDPYWTTEGEYIYELYKYALLQALKHGIASFNINALKYIENLKADVRYHDINYVVLLMVVQGFDSSKKESFEVLNFIENIKEKNIFYMRDSSMNTVWHLAARENKSGIIDWLYEGERLKYMINAINSIGETPLVVACKYNSIEAITALIKTGLVSYDEPDENGESLTFAAFSKNKTKTALALMKAGASLSVYSLKTENTLVHLAVQNENLALLEALTRFQKERHEAAKKRKCEPTYKDYFFIDTLNAEGKTALYLAVEQGGIELVKYLMGNDADPYFSCTVQFCQTTPIELAEKRVKSGMIGAVEILKQLLPPIHEEEKKEVPIVDANAILIQPAVLEKIEFKNDTSLLHLLASTSNVTVKMFRSLLDHGAEINKIDGSGYTALFLLINAMSTNMDNPILNNCLRELLYRGADPNIACDIVLQVNEKKEVLKGLSPLCFAAYLGNFEVCKILIEWGAVVQYYTHDNITPLMFAIYNGEFNLIKYLLQEGAQPYDNREGINAPAYPLWFTVEPYIKKNKMEVISFLKRYVPGNQIIYKAARSLEFDMCTALFHASKTGDKDTLVRLLERGADLHWVDGQGNTALHLAAANNQINTTRHLLEMGIYFNQRNKDGNSSLMIAAAAKNIDIVKLLLEYGADVHQKNLAGMNLLHQAAQLPFSSLVIMQLLLLRGARVEAVDKNGRTALMLACLAGKTDLVKFLILEIGVRVERRDKDGKTELDHAVASGNCELVRFLLEFGLESNVKFLNRESVLHSAVRLGNISMVELLLEYNICINARNKENKTALCLAIELDLAPIAQLLLSVPGIEWETAYSIAQKKDLFSNLAIFDECIKKTGTESSENIASATLLFSYVTSKSFTETKVTDEINFIRAANSTLLQLKGAI